MNLASTFNQYIGWTAQWLLRCACIWCGLALLIGLVLLDDKALAIAAPVMTIVMFVVGAWMLRTLIDFQRVNPFLNSCQRKKVIQWAIVFFWSCGIIGFLQFLLTGLFGNAEPIGTDFFLITASVFPLGASLGAAKEWLINCSAE